MMSYMNRRRSEKGFTLIELLIVVAIIGIIAAILIPNLIDSLQKAKQKRTMTDMKAIGTCWFSWVTDQIGAAAAGAGPRTYDVNLGTQLTFAELLDTLTQPGDPGFFYCQEVPAVDGWGTAFEFYWSNDPFATNVIAMRSAGRDRTFSGTTYNVGPYIATDYEEDIVWADGFFIYYPAGSQLVEGTAASQ